MGEAERERVERGAGKRCGGGKQSRGQERNKEEKKRKQGRKEGRTTGLE